MYHGRHVGTLGDAAAFSFFGNKMITTGEGGMVVFKDPAIAARAKVLRDHGMDPNRRYWHTEIGYNYRLTNLQAAIGVAQLEKIEQFIERKLDIADSYRSNLSEIKYVTCPAQRDGIRNIYWLFSILIDPILPGVSRDEMMLRLPSAGIETRNLFYPLHAMPPYARYACNRIFPNSDYLSANGLSLPSAVSLTHEELEHICATIRNYVNCREVIEMAG
jgi:perosamine synthetase